MISADPTVPDALNAQAWNRYSYVGNDPLAFTDPSGYSWLSSFFNAVTTFFSHVLANPIVRAIAQIALTVLLTPVAASIFATAAVAAASAAIINGVTGGNLGTMLRSAAIAGATAWAFNVVGDATAAVANTNGSGAAYAFNVAGHAGVGCLSAVASGGECGPGALSGGISAAATPLLPHDLVGGTVGHGLVGGLASVAGGGKFENGAVTAAFGYLYNEFAHGGCGGSANPTNEWRYTGTGDNPTGKASDPTSPWLERAALATGVGRAISVIADVLSGGSSNPFSGKTPDEIDKMFQNKGFDSRGPNPVEGKGGYVNPKTGRSYHIDPENSYGEPPHVDVNRPRDYNGSLGKKKFPM
jgi:hypothetical protein